MEKRKILVLYRWEHQARLQFPESLKWEAEDIILIPEMYAVSGGHSSMVIICSILLLIIIMEQ